jgi:hypothetical protein
VLVVTVQKRVYPILCVISLVFGVELQTILRFDLFKEFFDSVLGVCISPKITEDFVFHLTH